MVCLALRAAAFTRSNVASDTWPSHMRRHRSSSIRYVGPLAVTGCIVTGLRGLRGYRFFSSAHHAQNDSMPSNCADGGG